MTDAIFKAIGIYVVFVVSLAFLFKLLWTAIGGKERP